MRRYHGIIKTRTSSKYFAWTDGKELLVRKDGQGAPYPVDVVADHKGHVRLFGDLDMRSTRIVEWPESLRTVKVGTYTKHGFAPRPGLLNLLLAQPGKPCEECWDA